MYGLHGRDLPPLPKAALFRTDVRGKFKTGINGCMHVSLGYFWQGTPVGSVAPRLWGGVGVGGNQLHYE